MTIITLFQKASTMSTSSAAETDNVCIAKQEHGISAERTYFLKYLSLFLKHAVTRWFFGQWAPLSTSDHTFVWESNVAYHLFIYGILKVRKLLIRTCLTLRSCFWVLAGGFSSCCWLTLALKHHDFFQVDVSGCILVCSCRCFTYSPKTTDATGKQLQHRQHCRNSPLQSSSALSSQENKPKSSLSRQAYHQTSVRKLAQE